MSTRFSAEEIMIEFEGDIERIEQSYRKCSMCGKYTLIEEGAGEFETNEKTYYDICGYCIEQIEDNSDVEIEFDETYIEDYEDDYKEDEEDY